MDTVDCIVVGAGVIGLAIARQLAQLGRAVLVLEREAHFGSITSSRNSEVIHAGIYYPPGSQKARLCVRGRDLLYHYCRQYGVPYRRCGKLVVATEENQHSELEKIRHTSVANNSVDSLRQLERSEILALEPALHCTEALLSPETGIIDVHAYMLSLLGQAEAAGAVIAYRTRVVRLVAEADGIAVYTSDFDKAPIFKARCVVNSAGLDAPDIAAQTEGLPREHCPRAYFAKGSYFALCGRAPFSRLVYPVPEAGGLGVHLTLDLAGQARFGPDVQWVQQPDYQVDIRRADQFYQKIRRYWPGLKDGALTAGYAGVRPKITAPGEQAADFRIDGPQTHGVDGLINLFGIESPGLTASLAIAAWVGDIARTQCSN